MIADASSASPAITIRRGWSSPLASVDSARLLVMVSIVCLIRASSVLLPHFDSFRPHELRLGHRAVSGRLVELGINKIVVEIAVFLGIFDRGAVHDPIQVGPVCCGQAHGAWLR